MAFDLFKNNKEAQKLNFNYTTLPNLLKKADAVTLHVPATKETYHLLSTQEFKLLKKGVILINTARGDLIDTKALLDYLDKFYAVCLDVVENEHQFNQKHPLLNKPNVIITHCAFYTDLTVKKIAQETSKNIERFKKNDKTNRLV